MAGHLEDAAVGHRRGWERVKSTNEVNLGMDLLLGLYCSEAPSSLVTLFPSFFAFPSLHGTDAQRCLSMVGTLPRGTDGAGGFRPSG